MQRLKSDIPKRTWGKTQTLTPNSCPPREPYRVNSATLYRFSAAPAAASQIPDNTTKEPGSSAPRIEILRSRPFPRHLPQLSYINKLRIHLFSCI
jgi:hypothetical protein